MHGRSLLAAGCLECAGAYNASIVGMEREGLLDDPSYLAQLEQNDFSVTA